MISVLSCQRIYSFRDLSSVDYAHIVTPKELLGQVFRFYVEVLGLVAKRKSAAGGVWLCLEERPVIHLEEGQYASCNCDTISFRCNDFDEAIKGLKVAKISPHRKDIDFPKIGERSVQLNFYDPAWVSIELGFHYLA